jgi:hypothetical protein
MDSMRGPLSSLQRRHVQGEARRCARRCRRRRSRAAVPRSAAQQITHDAASGSSAIAVMTKAGHRNMSTTRTYLHLAGTVFRDEAERLEVRLLGAAESVESSTDLGLI